MGDDASRLGVVRTGARPEEYGAWREKMRRRMGWKWPTN